MENALPMDIPHNDEPHDMSFDDTTDFCKEVDADVDLGKKFFPRYARQYLLRPPKPSLPPHLT